MPIETQCPTCEKPYVLADNQAGKRVKCRHCADSFVVRGAPGADSEADDRSTKDAPSARSESRKSSSSGDGDDKDRRPRKVLKSNESGFPWVLAAVLGGVLLVLVLGLVGFLVFVASSSGPGGPGGPGNQVFDPTNVFAEVKTIDNALALLGQQDAGQRRKGADWLARQKVDSGRQKEVARALEKHKDDPDGWTREAILKALAVWGDRESMQVFLDIADTGKDNPWNIALDALAKHRELRAAPFAARDLAQWGRGDKCAAVLSAIGKPAEKHVVPLLNHRDDGVRRKAADWLKQWKTRSEVLNAQSLADLKGDDAPVRQHAAEHFARTAVDPKIQVEVARALEPAALSPERGLRDAGIKALLVWATRDSAGTLNAIMETDRGNRDRTMTLLAGWKDEKALVYVVSLFGSTNAADRRMAEKALKTYGALAEVPIQPLLQDKNTLIRRDTAKLLGEIGTKASLPALQQAKEKDRAIAAIAQKAIDEINKRK